MAKKKKVGLNNLALLASVATVLGMSSMVYFKMTRVEDNVLAATTNSVRECQNACNRIKLTSNLSQYKACVREGKSSIVDNYDLYVHIRTQVLGEHSAALTLTTEQENEIQRRMILYRRDQTKNRGTSEDVEKHCASLYKPKEYRKSCIASCKDTRIPKPTPMNADDIPTMTPKPTSKITAVPTPSSTPFQTPPNSNLEPKEEKENKNKPEKSSVITRQINYARDTLNRILAR